MPSFGENLRREREMRGVTLQEISVATKISVRFLQDLENEDFRQLPGGIFTRSFIRAYAKYLGLDEERVIAEYHLAVPSKSEFDLTRMAVGKSGEHREGSRGPVMALLLAAVLLGGGFLLYRYARTSSEPAATPPAVTPPAPTPPPAAANTPGAIPNQAPDSQAATVQSAAQPGPESAAAGTKATPPAGTAAASGAGAAAPAMPQPEEGLLLQVAATERVWIAIEADHKTALQRVLNPGEIETLKAKESFDITAGNAQGVVLTLNGETLKPLGRRGEVKSVHVSRNDLKKTSP